MQQLFYLWVNVGYDSLRLQCKPEVYYVKSKTRAQR